MRTHLRTIHRIILRTTPPTSSRLLSTKPGLKTRPSRRKAGSIACCTPSGFHRPATRRACTSPSPSCWRQLASRSAVLCIVARRARPHRHRRAAPPPPRQQQNGKRGVNPTARAHRAAKAARMMTDRTRIASSPHKRIGSTHPMHAKGPPRTYCSGRPISFVKRNGGRCGAPTDTPPHRAMGAGDRGRWSHGHARAPRAT